MVSMGTVVQNWSGSTAVLAAVLQQQESNGAALEQSSVGTAVLEQKRLEQLEQGSSFGAEQHEQCK
jgi:hypothetical protein